MNKRKIISLILALTIVCSFLVIQINAASPYAVVLPDPDLGGGTGTYSGIYNVKNIRHDKYLQIDDDVSFSTESAEMELAQFNASSSKKWHFFHLGDGYYQIISIASGLSLSVPANSSFTDGVTLVQETYVGESRQQWYIEETTRGTVMIFPRSAENNPDALTVLCMSTSVNLSSEPKVKQGAYTFDNVYNDEWLLYPSTASVINIEVLYDHAYLNRYPNAVSRISGMMAELKEKYLTQFDIVIEYSTPTLYTSYGDSCSTTPTQICTHATNANCVNTTNRNNLQTYHHKNIYNIINRVPLPNISSSFKVLFTGHDNCRIKTDENGNSVHETNTFAGLAYYTVGLVAVMNFSSLESELKTLVHEIDHIYGVMDHYDWGDAPTTEEIKNETGNYGYDRNCIHGENKNTTNVMNNLIICQGCKDIIEANKKAFDHRYG